MPRTLNFRQIEAFRAVMQSGTTTAAAAILHTTQPSISRLLAQMQSATQLKLFDIQKGRLRPTNEARQLFDIVQRQFLGMDRIEQNIAVMRKSGTGSLRIGCTPALGLSVMPRVVRAFSLRYPEVHINLQTIGAHHLRENLLHGLHDLVLTTTPIDHPHLDATILHRSNAVCVVHPQHKLATRANLHVRDLHDEALLTLNADDEIFLQLQATLQQYRIEARTILETTYSATICAMAAAGAGIGIVNPYVATVFANDLQILPLMPRCPVEVCLAFASQSAPSVIAEQFALLLKEYFHDFPRQQIRKPR